jgi:C1A family cysteine protease
MLKRIVEAAKNRSRKKYGWIPDIPDRRDITYGSVHPAPESLPASADLTMYCPAVEEQGNLGSCTANALAGALEYLELKDSVRFEDLSRLFIYYNERMIENSIMTDSGAMIRDGIKALKKQGVCSEKKWPYDISKFTYKPDENCFREALDHQITDYQRLNTLEEMRACLASGFPFVFGFTVYESFESKKTALTGVAHMPGPKERALGGHAVVAVGYNDAKKRFLVRNSWGAKWGKKGYFTMPYEYLSDRNLSDDFWTIRRAENM